MHSLKAKLLDQMLEHLDNAQGSDLKELMGKSNPLAGGEDPKGLKVESVEIMGKPGRDLEDKLGEEVAENDKGPSLDPEKVKQFQKGFNESGGWQPERWKKNLKEGLGLSAQADAPESKEPEMTDDELEELVGRYLNA